MRIKLILPALTEAVSPYFRPIKYSLFPPLGLATLAAYLSDDDAAVIVDEHVEAIDLDDQPELVAIQVYVTSAYRAYRLADHYRARGAYVVLGGLHVTSLPPEAERHADTIVLGPGEDGWPRFLADFRSGRPQRRYVSRQRTLADAPLPRRDLIQRHRYLVPNSIVVSRGCPHGCDFCYKHDFFRGGRSFYTRPVDSALREIESLPGRHLYFLDDHLLADARFSSALFDGMRGMGRLWQAAGTVDSVLRSSLVEKAREVGLRSLFIGFETLRAENLALHGKPHNRRPDFESAVKRLHNLGVMINASFVFGMDEDDPGIFDRTVQWSIRNGIETATFHVLTPYPGTPLHSRMASEGRLLHRNWDLYDTRHSVFRPRHMTPEALEQGYRRAYRDFYRWGSILRSASTKGDLSNAIRHLLYTGGWKKAEPFWNWIIKTGHLGALLPVLERVLSGREQSPTSPAKQAWLDPALIADDRPLSGE